MIASLPMYDWPEMQGANDRLWYRIRDALRAEGIAAPDTLTRGEDLWDGWHNPRLLLGQTCGFPFRTALHGVVTLVGTPDYALPGAPAAYYYSQLVAGTDSAGDWTAFIDQRLAINGFDSQSGWAAPQNHAARIGRRFERIVVSGAHRDSARMVAEGDADVAAIDAVTWRLLTTYHPEIVAKLKILAQTEPTPGLPLITVLGRDPQPLARAFAAAVAAMSAEDRAVTGLRGLVQVPAQAYLAVATPAPSIAAR